MILFIFVSFYTIFTCDLVSWIGRGSNLLGNDSILVMISYFLTYAFTY